MSPETNLITISQRGSEEPIWYFWGGGQESRANAATQKGKKRHKEQE